MVLDQKFHDASEKEYERGKKLNYKDMLDN